VEKFTIPNPLSLKIACKFPFPTARLKMSFSSYFGIEIS
jgi:hypothetical protein